MFRCTQAPFRLDLDPAIARIWTPARLKGEHLKPRRYEPVAELPHMSLRWVAYCEVGTFSRVCWAAAGWVPYSKQWIDTAAICPPVNRHVAIKFLNDETGNRPKVLSNLRREFYCAHGLSHRSIVKVYELDRDDDFEFFTMELLEGEPLSSALERSRPFAMSSSNAWAHHTGDRGRVWRTRMHATWCTVT